MRSEQSAAAVPVYILTGFLGSGKTTLLTRAVAHAVSQGRKPAVIMNELGDVNLDGLLLDGSVPTAEMLGGCICCTIRGDLGMEIKALLDREAPDVLFIEATGAANPMEIIDGVTEAALYGRIELRSVVAVVDGPALVERSKSGKGQTYRLMRDQIRCADRLVLNKTDRLEPDELVLAQSLVREWNGKAPLEAVVRGMADLSMFDGEAGGALPAAAAGGGARAGAGSASGSVSCGASDGSIAGDEGPGAAAAAGAGTGTGAHTEHHACGPACSHGHEAHASHAHVMALTHYFRGPVDSQAFEALLGRLPDNVYRAKGIVSFTDTASKRFLFQYAFRESDFIGIAPQGEVHDVAVFIGEHFEREPLVRELEALEANASCGKKLHSSI